MGASIAVKEVNKPAKYDYNTNEYDKVLEPDEDFYSAITKEELLKGIHEDIEKFFASK